VQGATYIEESHDAQTSENHETRIRFLYEFVGVLVWEKDKNGI
jgi:hypothetical protein